LLELNRVLDEWGLDEISLWPEIWGKESVGLLKTLEYSSAEIFSGSGLTNTGGIDIIDTSELEDLLGDLSGNATSSSWSWDHSDDTGTALTLDLAWDGMDSTDSGSPISSSDWDKVDLGVNESTLDGDLDLLGDLDTNTDVTLSVSASDDSLESGSLSSLGLLLDGKDAHNLIGELSFLVGEKFVGNLRLLDWDGMGIDFLEGVDLSVLNQSSEFGNWVPLVFTTSSSESTSASTATSSTSSTESSTSVSTSVTTSTSSWLRGSICGSFSWGSSWDFWSCLCWGFHFS